MTPSNLGGGAHNTTRSLTSGAISTLFYWEVVTAESEIIYFYRWAYAQGLDPDRNGFQAVFQRYLRESGRAEVIRQADPLHADFVG